MTLLAFLFLAAESASPGITSIPDEVAKATPGTQWATIIYSTITALLALGTSFWFSKKKQRTDDFAAFMEESADFREEIRKELDRKTTEYEKEVDKYKKALADQILETEKYRKDNEECILRYRSVLDFLPAIVWTADAFAKTDFFNNRWYEYSSMSFDLAKDGGWKTAIHPEDAETFDKLWKLAMQRNMPFESKLRLQKGDGTYHPFIFKVTPRYDSHGRVTQWIGAGTDVAMLVPS